MNAYAWPIGFSTGCFFRSSLFDHLEPIVRHGFNMIEVTGTPSHLDYHNAGEVKKAAAMAASLGIEVYSFHAPFSEHIDISSLDDAERQYSSEELLMAAEAAATFEARFLVVHPGPEKPLDALRHERLERLEKAAEVLNRVGERCGELGIRVALENMTPQLLHGPLMSLLGIFGALTQGEATVCLDTGHAFLGGDLVRVVRKLAGAAAMIHAHDNRGGGDDHLCPGEGGIDWTAFFAEINRYGFDGGIILEMAGIAEGENSEAVLARAAQSRLFLRAVCRTLALRAGRHHQTEH